MLSDADVSLFSDETPQKRPEVIKVDGVEISPASMLFANAYENKIFKQKLTIQNKGKMLAFVRVCKPNSQAYDIKVFPEGHYLSPGLRIVRTVTYIYNRALAVPNTFMPICVNDTWIEYKFHFTVSTPVISIKPQQLNFGKVDAINTANIRMLDITNSGYKATLFSVDLGRNELGIVVEPMKGIIYAHTTITLSVEIYGTKEGDFVQEFWIKTVPPMRVVVTVSFISPKLTIAKFYNKFDFTLLDFPKTYVSSKSTVPFFIKNDSSSNSMFYVMAEVRGVKMSLVEASEKSEDYLNFSVKPIEGRLFSERGNVIQITFQPHHRKKKRLQKNYAACFLRVLRLPCRDLDYQVFDDTSSSCWEQSIRDSVSILAIESEESNVTLAKSEFYEKVHETDDFPSFLYEDHSLRVCLHGEIEEADVIVRPDFIVLTHLELKKVIKRVLFFENVSSHLPILLTYQKVSSIDVSPNKITLKPSGKAEVELSVRPSKFGRISKNIVFHLLAPDTPVLDPIIHRKVGEVKVKVEIQANVLAIKKRLGKCCINDEMKNLRNIETVPENSDYDLTSNKKQLKKFNKIYYPSYMRQSYQRRTIIAERSEEILGTNYYFAKQKLALQKEACCQIQGAVLNDNVKSFSLFIPLTPKQLYNIIVYPRFIKLKKIAPRTSIRNSFTIENRNNFPIRIFLNASKDWVSYGGNPRSVIRANEKRKIFFDVASNVTGVYNVSLDVIINECHVMQLVIIAEVTPLNININEDVIVFSKDQDSYQFLELSNDLNISCGFQWDVPSSCFDIFPRSGKVPADRSITCIVTYVPKLLSTEVVECTLISESGCKQIVTIRHKNTKCAISFDCDILDLGKIPLNIPVCKELTMKNSEKGAIIFAVTNTEPLKGISIAPYTGILAGSREQVFEINILLKAPIIFSTKACFTINIDQEIEVEIRGEVEVPNISIKPNFLYFRKINPYCFDIAGFSVENQGDCTCIIEFPVEEFPEFTVTSKEDFHLPHENHLSLNPKSSQMLFLHLHPRHVTTYALYCPLVLNAIIGPARIKETQSIKTDYYLHEYKGLYSVNQEIYFKSKYPKVLPLLRVTCCAVDKIVELSETLIHLKYFGPQHIKNRTVEFFEVSNTSDMSISVCIRTDDLKEPFSLVPKTNIRSIEIYEVSYKITLSPTQKFVFQLDFLPEKHGQYFMRLPIFIREAKDDKVFNYLTVSGIYEYPGLTPSEKVLYFLPVPTKTTNEYQITLKLIDHKSKCNLSFHSENPHISATFIGGPQVTGESGEIQVIVSIVSDHSLCYDEKVIFSCDCGSQCEVEVRGVIERCILTSHFVTQEITRNIFNAPSLGSNLTIRNGSSLELLQIDYCKQFVNTTQSCFPFFPTDEDISLYAEEMRKLNRILEKWVSSQGFGCQKYFRIPEDFVEFPNRTEEKMLNFGMRANATTADIDLPVVELLLNLTGRSVRKYLVTTPIPSPHDDEIYRMIYCYTTYTNVLAFLRNYSACLPNVSPKYLLNYDHYLLYKKSRSEHQQIKHGRGDFCLLSKQCWIDLILQICKTLVFNRLEISIPDSGADENSELGLYHKKQSFLLEWMANIYKEEREVLWPKRPPPINKRARFFDEDLKDGLLLGAITGHYCPYVRHYIDDMFTSPDTPEQLFHNSCKLKQAWMSLNFTFDIEPWDITIRPTLVGMFLLVVYLYELLPSCQPIDVLTIEVPLSEIGVMPIDVKNRDETTIYYRPIFFNNKDNLFYINSEHIRIEPRRTSVIKVNYHAKFMKSGHSFLLLSGEVPGHKYAKNLAFELNGLSTPKHVQEFYFTVKLYSATYLTLKIESPHKTAAEYSLYLSLVPTCDASKLISFEEFKSSMIPDNCPTKYTTAVFDEEGKWSSVLPVYDLVLADVSRWIHFAHPNLGDFSVKLKLSAEISKKCFEQIQVELPMDYDLLECTCPKEPSIARYCPKRIKIHIPSKNNMLWNARRSLMLQGLHSQREFWEEQFSTAIGSRILHLVMHSQPRSREFLNSRVFEANEMIKYEISPIKNSQIMTPRSIIIEDTTSEKTVPLFIHSLNNAKKLEGAKAYLRLMSENDEVRLYELSFMRTIKTS